MRLTRPALAAAFLLSTPALLSSPAMAQFGPGGPPSVGVIEVQKRGVIESQQFVGRMQAIDKVDITARITAVITERAFVEGGEVQKGDLLYRLERGTFEAALASAEAAVAQMTAMHANAVLTTNRAGALLSTPAGQRSTYDAAVAAQASWAAQLKSAEAQVRIAQINLDYTEIRAPVAGKVGRSSLAIGNVVTPTSGPLVSVVSQDPMYVLFPVPVRTVDELRTRYAAKGGFAAVKIRLRMPDGKDYAPTGTLDYADPSVTPGTDTITLRARMPNPIRPGAKPGEPGNRELIDGAFVSVTVEGNEPVQALAIPRAAVMQDQQGSFVYVLDAEKKVQNRRIRLGATQGTQAIVLDGLAAGDTIVAEGLQRVRPGIAVNPTPVGAPPPGAPPAGGPPAAAPKPQG